MWLLPTMETLEIVFEEEGEEQEDEVEVVEDEDSGGNCANGGNIVANQNIPPSDLDLSNKLKFIELRIKWKIFH